MYKLKILPFHFSFSIFQKRATIIVFHVATLAILLQLSNAIFKTNKLPLNAFIFESVISKQSRTLFESTASVGWLLY